MIATHLKRNVHLVRFESGMIEFNPERVAPKDLAGQVGKLLSQWTGARWVVSVVNAAGAPTLARPGHAPHGQGRSLGQIDPRRLSRGGHRNRAPTRLISLAFRKPPMKNLGQIMKQVQDMQSRMAEMQDKLGEIEVTGASGGGMVQATVNGKGDVRRIKIDPSLLKPEEAEVLEDLIVAAVNDAKSKADAHSQD